MARSESCGALLSRRRRANVDGGRQRLQTVGVSPEGRGSLVRLARGQSINTQHLLVEAAPSLDERETLAERKYVTAELLKLHRLLDAFLNNVNQIAHATNATAVVPDEMCTTLDAVRRTTDRIDEAVHEMSR